MTRVVWCTWDPCIHSHIICALSVSLRTALTPLVRHTGFPFPHDHDGCKLYSRLALAVSNGWNTRHPLRKREIEQVKRVGFEFEQPPGG
ncbi:hypothetical protein Hypma_010553 [Hypsizygus marmoreus]|uniref:Uncharacterized protein n=1 Tax=Hypsizygus marmoreus TaxID=39966 RepID=A0A369JP79_HYPMA|nr:hypothetical protein Hypma_010553 [Hypsizygus marmoreus]